MKFFEDENTNTKFMLENMMGPNSVMLLSELLENLNLNKDMKILDLGCGTGLTSLFLAKKTGAQIFAADLWIDPKDNYRRFKELGFDKQIIPLHLDAQKQLPFAESYFDAVISVDSFHYYGAKEGYLDEYIVPIVKPNGKIAIATPGLQKDFENDVPAEMQPYWQDDMHFYSVEWWKELWQKSANIKIDAAFSLKSHTEAWQQWLKCDNPYSKRDIDMIKTEGGKYFNTVGLIATVIK
ncbi:cyclopropane fatty-acyl-phospholipid synthase-like methyltransferase [Elusimicrobium posterum]|uniref:SAM-dependent methyltransferase n=1 Tax=Elusimicrobium posterum TaxID=3116653 RepID=UPI003C772308